MIFVQRSRTAFDADAAGLVDKEAFQTALSRLRDSLTAIKQVPAAHPRPIEALTQQLRSLELIIKAADDDTFPSSPHDLRRYRRRSVELPAKDRLLSIRAWMMSRRKKRARPAKTPKAHVARPRKVLSRATAS